MRQRAKVCPVRDELTISGTLRSACRYLTDSSYDVFTNTIKMNGYRLSSWQAPGIYDWTREWKCTYTFMYFEYGKLALWTGVSQ